MIYITDKKIYIEEFHKELSDNSCGAVVTFEGRVRNHHEDKQVVKLYYECYCDMAEKIMEKIKGETFDKFNIKQISMIHRVGNIPVGELAVWIGIASEHRGEAFIACKHVIDQIKTKVPIWKKETYSDESLSWTDCCHTELKV